MELKSSKKYCFVSVNILILIIISSVCNGRRRENLNCMLARQVCIEDKSCRNIMEIIPKVCGSTSGSCSTGTVSRCRAALRTLQSFPFFQPTCLCREPQVDPHCNAFRDFLFDHPCNFVLKEEYPEPYPIHALPTCDYALQVCQKNANCFLIFEKFNTFCLVKDDLCITANRTECLSAWLSLKRIPILGCICPNNQIRSKCNHIFKLIHNNPCISTFAISDLDHVSINEETIVSSVISFPNSLSIQEKYKLLIGEVDDLLGWRNIHRSREENLLSLVESSSNEETTMPSTCQSALTSCLRNKTCNSLFKPVMLFCSEGKCDQHKCRSALRYFYANSYLQWSLPMAFCVCRATNETWDQCMLAQSKLHPQCALESSGEALPKCHQVSSDCRSEASECRYEQACATDSDTLRCTADQDDCQEALIGILGTSLHVYCACNASEAVQWNECVGWRRIIWANPCVKICTVSKVLFESEQGMIVTEGIGIRLYRQPNAECSDLCYCLAEEQLVCSEICVEATPCQSAYAVYTHGSPSFQAYRGECICYSGHFICMKPNPDDYQTDSGVFLFLGYSQADEEVLSPKTRLRIDDSVKRLQEFIRPFNTRSVHAHCRSQTTIQMFPQIHCVLSMYRKMENNLIVKATVDQTTEDAQLNNTDHELKALKEWDVCGPLLYTVRDMINRKDPVIYSDIVISMIKVAEVELVSAPKHTSSSCASVFQQTQTILILIASTVVLQYRLIPGSIP